MKNLILMLVSLSVFGANTNKELERKIDILADEIAALKSSQSNIGSTKQAYGLGQAASKVYFNCVRCSAVFSTPSPMWALLAICSICVRIWFRCLSRSGRTRVKTVLAFEPSINISLSLELLLCRISIALLLPLSFSPLQAT